MEQSRRELIYYKWMLLQIVYETGKITDYCNYEHDAEPRLPQLLRFFYVLMKAKVALAFLLHLYTAPAFLICSNYIHGKDRVILYPAWFQNGKYVDGLGWINKMKIQ